MKIYRGILPRAAVMFAIFTIVCGVIYTGVATGIAQLAFPNKANGSIIAVNGEKYGSELLGQYYTDDSHMWGRVMVLDTTTYKGKDGEQLLYSAPSNLSPGSKEYAEAVEERIIKLRASNPEMKNTDIPEDLVTCSGSGLDPGVSVAAAMWQAPRIAESTGKTEDEVNEIVDKCTSNRFLGIFGEKTVNVLKVNLMLDGIIE